MPDTSHQHPMTDLVQSTGALLKSVGRFSIGMSLLAAKQAASFVMPAGTSTPDAASMDDVTRAAGEHLGPVRTAPSARTCSAWSARSTRGRGPKGSGRRRTSDLAIPMTTGEPGG